MSSLGFPRRHFRSTDSTNARAKELADAGAPDGLVVTADEQSAGRGRQGRSWFAPAGAALLYSALLRPAGERPLLPIAVPLAVCTAAESVADVSCEVKWPNDVWLEGRKLAGILIESRPGPRDDGWTVIGVGLNLAIPEDEFPAELRGSATSLAASTAPGGGSAGGPDHGDVLAAVNHELERWVDARPARILESFRERDALRERRISWEGGSGVAAGIDESGHLLVATDPGEIALGAGEVHLSLED